MPRYNYNQNNFSGGELGETVKGRTDTKEYQNGLTLLKNFLPVKGARKRPGLQYVQRPVMSETCTIIPFFGNQDERFFIVIDNNDKVSNAFWVYNVGTDSWISSTISNTFNNYSFGSVRFKSTWSTSGYHYAQKDRILIITHESGEMPPIHCEIITSITNGTKSVTARGIFDIDALFSTSDKVRLTMRMMAWQDKNSSTVTLALSGAGGGATVGDIDATASSVTVTAGSAFFDAGHAGTVFRNTYSSVEGAFQITAVASSTSATATILIKPNGTAATVDWRECSWSPFRGWPRTCCFFEDRLVYGASLHQPSTFWGSWQPFRFNKDHPQFMPLYLEQDTTGDASLLNYYGPFGNTAPYSFSPNSSASNNINMIGAVETLAVGGYEGIYRGGGGEGSLGINNQDVALQSAIGAGNIQPVKTGSGLIYVSFDKKSLIHYRYNDEARRYHSINLSTLNPNIVQIGFPGTGNYRDIQIKQIAFQQTLETIWVVTTDGSLISVSTENDRVFSWARHISGTASDIQVESIAVLPSYDFTTEELWVAVKRTVNSVTGFYLERIGDFFEHALLKNTSTHRDDQPWFADSAIRIKAQDACNFSPPNNSGGSGNIIVTGIIAVADVSTNDRVACSVIGTGLATGTRVQVSSTGSLPTGLSASTDYYIIRDVYDGVSLYYKFATSLANAQAGTAIDLTGNGTTDFSVYDFGIADDNRIEIVYTIAHTLSTGDKVQVASGGTLPAGLSAATDYWIIRDESVAGKLYYKFATSRANALAGTAIDLTDTGDSSVFSITVQSLYSIALFNSETLEDINSLGVAPNENLISNSKGLYTGMKVQITELVGTLPTDLSTGTDYYLIMDSVLPYITKVGFATSEANALAGTAIEITDLTATGTMRITPEDATSSTWSVQHLKGKTVNLIADGVVETGVTVDSDGKFSTTSAVSEVIVGLPYTATLKTLPSEAGAQIGSAQGAIRRIDRLFMKIHKTAHLTFGSVDGDLEDLGLAGVITDGDQIVDFPHSPDREGIVIIESSDPLPCNVVTLTERGVLND